MNNIASVSEWSQSTVSKMIAIAIVLLIPFNLLQLKIVSKTRLAVHTCVLKTVNDYCKLQVWIWSCIYYFVNPISDPLKAKKVTPQVLNAWELNKVELKEHSDHCSHRLLRGLGRSALVYYVRSRKFDSRCIFLTSSS